MAKFADPVEGRPEETDNIALNIPQRLPGPSSISDTGLSEDFLIELAVKHIFYLGNFRMRDLCEKMLLPAWIIEPLIQKLRDEKFCEVKGGTGFQSASYQFSVTADGRRRALEYLEKCLYTGPAPVSLEQYSRVVAGQSVSGISVNEKDLTAAFSEYVVGKRIVDQLGAAVNSGRSIFLYGPAGNGKTVLAEALGGVLRDTVYIPHSIAVNNAIIRVFDPITHVPACDNGPECDRRWVRCRRPVVLTGGELTLEMLDLEYNPVYRFYEAPFQLKANGGLLIIDDFGRQLVRPRDLLNRWVVPLERKADFLTLHTGQKFEVPFDELVVFSTNLAPRDLADEAFLRRIRYKVKIDRPTEPEYREIFRRNCVSHGLEYRQEVVGYLLSEQYAKRKIALNACHPRDIVEQLLDIARYQGGKAELTEATVNQACMNYFVDM